MIISNDSMDFNDPKEFDDPQLLGDPSYSMIPAIRWSPAIWWSQAIWWSPAILWSIGSMDLDNPKAYSDTFISDGLVYLVNWNLLSKLNINVASKWTPNRWRSCHRYQLVCNFANVYMLILFVATYSFDVWTSDILIIIISVFLCIFLSGFLSFCHCVFVS